MPSDLYIVVASRPENIPAGLTSEDEATREKAILQALTRMDKIWFGEADWSIVLDTTPTDIVGPSDKLISLMGKNVHVLTIELSGKIVAMADEPDRRDMPRSTTFELAKFLGEHQGYHAFLVMQ